MNKNKSIFFQVVGFSLLAVAGYLALTTWELVLWVVGLLMGLAIPWLDERLFFSWYQGKTIDSISQYITRSLLFLLAYGAASIFVVTSTQGRLGVGLVLGLGLVLLTELVLTCQSSSQLSRLLGVRQPLKKNEGYYLVAGFALGYLMLVVVAVTK